MAVLVMEATKDVVPKRGGQEDLATATLLLVVEHDASGRVYAALFDQVVSRAIPGGGGAFGLQVSPEGIAYEQAGGDWSDDRVSVLQVENGLASRSLGGLVKCPLRARLAAVRRDDRRH